MAEPTQCECGWLGLCLNDSTTPVDYDAQSNSFHFVGADGSRLMLYFCPMCGGKFPDSNHQIDVPVAPSGELDRLNELVGGLTTSDASITRLGKPCYDGLMKTYWNTNGSYDVDETQSPIRNIEYYELSKWYTVEFYFDQNESEVRIVPKALNAKQLDGKFDHPEYPNLPIVGDLDSELLGNGDI